MQDLESNNWITLDSIGNIYEIYAYLTVMTTLLNLSCFWISWIISKMCICKSKFHVCYHYLRYENIWRKNSINSSCPTEIIKIKMIWRFYEGQKAFIKPFWGTKKKCKMKNLGHFPPLFVIWITRVKAVLLSK